MTLQDLGNIGEFVAAIATLATLAYLAVQSRQNTEVVRTSNYSELTYEMREFARQIAGDSELMDIWQRGLDDYRSLPDLERGRFHMLVSQPFISHQLQMQLRSRGMLDDQFYQQQQDGLAELFEASGVQKWWSSEKRWYTAGFQDFIDREFTRPAAQQGAAANRPTGPAKRRHWSVWYADPCTVRQGLKLSAWSVMRCQLKQRIQHGV